MHWTAGHRRGLPRQLGISIAAGKQAILDFVFANAHPVPWSGCWIWMGPVNGDGYAFLVDPTKPFCRESPFRIGIHRLVCETVHGHMPDDYDARHQCHIKTCVCPDHLLPGTRSDNLNDSVRDGHWTFTRGMKNGRARLTPEMCGEIRMLRDGGATNASLAERFGVGTSTISRVTTGHHWTAA